MVTRTPAPRAPRPDRRPTGGDGVALPVALVALIMLSLLISGLLVGSATDAVLSQAHRDAVEDLYLAESAIHAWSAMHADTPLAAGVFAWQPPGGGPPVRLEVERLAGRLPGDTATGTNALFSIHASPHRSTGGRAVVSLFRARERGLPGLDLEVGGPLVLGGGGRLVGGFTGEVLVHDALGGPFCDGPGTGADYPALSAQGASLQLLAGAVVQGVPQTSPLPAPELIASTTPGLGIRDLAWHADLRLGRFFNEPDFEPDERPASDHPDRRYDWGCPRALVDLIRSAAPGPAAPAACAAGADSSRYVAVAIDAGNTELRLTGHHGQGVLIVVNGRLHITGSFVFQGLVLAEGDVVISGAGAGWPPSIEGALVAGGSVRIDRNQTPAGLGGGGSRSVRFNRCALQRAAAALNGPPGSDPGRPRGLGRPHGWFEALH